MFTIKSITKSYYAYVECTPKEELPDGHVLLVDGVNNICTLDAFIVIRVNNDDDIEYILDNADEIYNTSVYNTNFEKECKLIPIENIYKYLGR